MGSPCLICLSNIEINHCQQLAGSFRIIAGYNSRRLHLEVSQYRNVIDRASSMASLAPPGSIHIDRGSPWCQNKLGEIWGQQEVGQFRERWPLVVSSWWSVSSELMVNGRFQPSPLKPSTEVIDVISWYIDMDWVWISQRYCILIKLFRAASRNGLPHVVILIYFYFRNSETKFDDTNY